MLSFNFGISFPFPDNIYTSQKLSSLLNNKEKNPPSPPKKKYKLKITIFTMPTQWRLILLKNVGWHGDALKSECIKKNIIRTLTAHSLTCVVNSGWQNLPFYSYLPFQPISLSLWVVGMKRAFSERKPIRPRLWSCPHTDFLAWVSAKVVASEENAVLCRKTAFSSFLASVFLRVIFLPFLTIAGNRISSIT